MRSPAVFFAKSIDASRHSVVGSSPVARAALLSQVSPDDLSRTVTWRNASSPLRQRSVEKPVRYDFAFVPAVSGSPLQAGAFVPKPTLALKPTSGVVPLWRATIV